MIKLQSYPKNHIDAIVKEVEDSLEWRMIGFYKAFDICDKE